MFPYYRGSRRFRAAYRPGPVQWLEALPPGRGGGDLRRRVDELLTADVVATTGMARLELPGGSRSQREWPRLRQLLSALHPLAVT